MTEYQPKDWREEIQFFIVHPKKEWRERFYKFFEKLLNCTGFTDKHKEIMGDLLDLNIVELPGFMWDGGQVYQEKFERVCARFNRLEWLVDEFGKVIVSEHFLTWLKAPCPFLDGKRPIFFLADDEQFEKLREMIWRLASGTPS